MKSKYVLLASAFVLSMNTQAQKDQIKAAEKALKGGNAAEAMSSLAQAEPLLTAASETEKAQFHFVKGNAALDLAAKKMDAAANLKLAANSYKQVLAIEKAAGKSKYTGDAQIGFSKAKDELLSAAQIEANKETKEGSLNAANLLFASYEMDKTNMLNLYFAAYYFMNAGDYDNAINFFEELKKLNFSGELTNYYAKNMVTENEDYYGSDEAAKKNRDNQVLLKLATSPRDEKSPSKKGEIAKYIALIYVEQGKIEQAKSALADAIIANPDDISIMQSEADLMLKMNDIEGYKTIASKIVLKEPNNPDIFYNLGVTSTNADPIAAEQYYKRAIEIKPDYINAYLNLAMLTLNGEKKLVDEMNKLGTSEKDTKKYDVLKKKRDGLFQASIPYLEKALELNPDNADVATTLLNVYGALEMMDKKKALKAKMNAAK